jgi:hypothetical protein
MKKFASLFGKIVFLEIREPRGERRRRDLPRVSAPFMLRVLL